MRDLANEKPIVFVEGDDDRVVIERSEYASSLFSSQYSTAFSILKRLIEVPSEDVCYPGQGNSRIIAFCGDRGAGKTSCMMSVPYARGGRGVDTCPNIENQHFTQLFPYCCMMAA